VCPARLGGGSARSCQHGTPQGVVGLAHDESVGLDEPGREDGRVPAASPWQGHVQSVSGRGIDGTRGLAPVHEVALSRPGGSELRFERVRDIDAADVRAHLIGVPAFQDFGRCPICGTASDLTREHVPQGDLGGGVMTMTCRTCNNRLGSRVEGELRDWFDDAIGSVRFSGGDVPGRRRVGRVLLRTTVEGEFGLIIDPGKSDAELRAMLASGQLEMHYRTPIATVWRLAALKHAYLGACLSLGEIPDSPLAGRVRADLIAARDWERSRPFPESRIAGGLRVARSYRAAQGPRVALAALVDDEAVMQDGGLSFAGTLFVSWPLEAELFWSFPGH